MPRAKATKPKGPEICKPNKIHSPRLKYHIDWSAIEVLYTSGQLKLAQISLRYNIGISALKSRSSRGEWDEKRKSHLKFLESTPCAELPPLAPIQRAGDEEVINERPPEFLSDADSPLMPQNPAMDATKNGVSATMIAQDTWARRQLEHRDLAYRKAHGALRNAKLAPPKDWKSAEIVDRMARKASGLDEDSGPKVNVSVNVGFLNGGIS